MPGHTKSAAPVTKNHLSKPEDLMLQNATPLRKSAAWPPHISDEHVWWRCLLYCACHAKSIFADPLQMSNACHHFWTCYKTLTFLLTFVRVENPLRLSHKTTLQRPKAARTCVLYILTSKCASRHNGVHFLNISTAKNALNVVCFVRAPQRRALFQHLNFQKCSERGVLCTFWLRNVFRATTACTFSSLIRPDGSAPAALASLLFDPLEPQNIGILGPDNPTC